MLNRKSFTLAFLIFYVFQCLSAPCLLAEETEPKRQFAPRSSPLPDEPKRVKPTDKEYLIQNFEDGSLENNLGGESGSWNLDPDDENSTVEISIVDEPKKEKSEKPSNKALQIIYNVNSDGVAQNGYWTKLKNLDASLYDHLQFDIKGDADTGFTDVIKIELKKFKDDKRVEKIKGVSIVRSITSEWQTIQIPLNKMTGLLNFSDPKVWENPALGRKDMDEFVIVFESRRATKKTGTLYLDNLKLVNLGKKLPTAVDFPPRKKGEKTPVPLRGVDFAKFLVGRLQGYPKQVVVKKEFPKNDKEFLMTIAKDTWRFFDEIVDKEHQLPLDTIQLGEKEPIAEDGFVGDYTNVTNIGLYLMCLVAAYDFKFITREDAVSRITRTMDTLDKLEGHKSGFLYNYYDTTTIERTSYFVSLVDSGWLDLGLYVVKNAFPELKERAEKMLSSHSFAFFYDPVEQQMYHGYYDHLEVYSDYHYGSFYTEPRATSFMAIGRGEVPVEHWFKMMRTFPESYSWQTQEPHQRSEKTVLGVKYDAGFYVWKDKRFVPSWGGSMFEALMPPAVISEKELSPDSMGLNNQRHVDITIDYSLNDLGMPVWGMSPSSVPEGGYSEFGVKVLGARGYPDGAVTPHASVLALEYAPEAVVKNLRTMIEKYEIYGEYGFYDALNPKTGKIARKYLALDQGMIFVALDNYLNDGAIRKRFAADEVAKKAAPLLAEEKLFEDVAQERRTQAQPIGLPKPAAT